MLNKQHHIAVIVSDYERSKDFYCRVLGMEIIREVYRETRQSWKCDLSLNGVYLLELFTFPEAPKRATRPEAMGLRHLAFEVNDLDSEITRLQSLGVTCEPVRVDEFTGARFTFLEDPDGLPLELVEAVNNA